MSAAPVKITKEMLGGAMSDEPAEAPYMTYDLGNLAAAADLDIDWKSSKNEEYLHETAKECIQHLVNQLFSMPSEPSPEETGRLITLPDGLARLPRTLPVPADKALTKWEMFAKTKGIKKRKREHKVWDEDLQEWKSRFGKDRANNEERAWVVDHKDGEDFSDDPWQKMKKARKANVEKNKKQQEANIRRAQQGSRQNVPGALDLSSLVGKDRGGKRNSQHKEKKSKGHLDIALQVAQTSTNSMGKFDVKRKGEGKIKARKMPSNVASLQKIANDHAQSAQVMKKVLGKVKEKDAVVMDRAMHSVKAMDMKAGELKTAKGIAAKRAFKSKMASAKTNAGVKRAQAKNDRASGKGGKKGRK